MFSELGGNATQAQKLIPGDGVPTDWFGRSVAVDGDTMLVGTPFSDAGGVSRGAAYFYARSDLALAVDAPASVAQGGNYVSQTIATNNTGVASPVLTAIVTVPVAAGFVSATPSQGSCSEASGGPPVTSARSPTTPTPRRAR